jgi:hypothetical protein
MLVCLLSGSIFFFLVLFNGILSTASVMPIQHRRTGVRDFGTSWKEVVVAYLWHYPRNVCKDRGPLE